MQKNYTALFLALIFASTPALAKNSPSSLSLLSDAERSYYDQSFGYAMDNMEAGKNYEWASYSGKGTIHVDEVFQSKSNIPCRNYSETFNVQNIMGSYSGTACKRQGEEGWCRLKPGNAKTCAMEDRGFMFSMPSMSGPDVNVGTGNNPISGVRINSPGSPNVNTNIGVEGPKKPSGKPGEDYATTVTSNAGKAAGSAASNGLGWFARTFGR